MAAAKHQIARAALRCGMQFVEARFRTEVAWCDRVLAVRDSLALQRSMIEWDELRTAADELALLAKRLESSVRELNGAIDKFKAQYAAAWRQRSMPQGYGKEPEFAYEEEELLLRSSPTRNSCWTPVLSAYDAIAEHLDEAAGCIKLGQALHEELCPPHDVEAPSADDPNFASELSDRSRDLRQLLAGVVQAFPFLEHLTLAEWYFSAIDFLRDVRVLEEDLLRCLADPPPTREFLNIVLDHARFRASRNDKTTGSLRGVGWHLLRVLLKRRGRPCEQPDLEEAWPDAARERPSAERRSDDGNTEQRASNRFHRALSTLRKELAKIGCRIEKEGDGWVLCVRESGTAADGCSAAGTPAQD